MYATLVPHSARRLFLTVLAVVVASGLILLALLVPFAAPLSEPPLQVGDVAPQDLLAPKNLTFRSDVLTVELREKAIAEVTPAYTPTDTSIARNQLENLRSTLAYISSVRADGYATQEQKLRDLAALENIQLLPETALGLLNLSEARWQAVQQEAIIVLEQVMRSTIRDDRLEEVRRDVPTLISLSLTENQAAMVTDLVIGFVVPNSLYSESLTTAAQQQARASVQTVHRTYVTGETIVQHGKVLSEADLEALEQFGLNETQYRWQDLVSASVLSVLAMTFLTIYVRRQRSFSHDPRDLGLIAALFLMFLFGARLTIPGHTIFPYMLPLAAYGMTISTLYGAEPALVTMLPLAVLITYGLPFSLELTLYYTLTGFFGVFVLGRALRVATFFTAAAAISLSGVGVILVYRFSNPSTDWIGLITLVAAALFNGIASSGSTLILQFFLAQMLGKTTPLQLIELSRPDHPLLQLLLRNAPGTYQHSLQVANLVEQAAEQIGADPLLTRVGALYHDIGKAVNAVFFIENQGPGNLDSHDDLDPATSASLVIDHVTSGLELARKYHLPRRIQDFIAEHHGTMVTRYQYAKALKGSNGDESKVDISKFRYPGPRPHSRETALLMLADGCEAHIRADRPKDEDELRSLIKNLVRERVANGALDDADLTLRDLDSVVNSFTATLRGVYHPRIQYPRLEPVPEALEAQTPPSKAEPVDGSGPSTDVESSSPSVG